MLFQPQRPACSSLNPSNMFSPQALGSCFFLCLNPLPPHVPTASFLTFFGPLLTFLVQNRKHHFACFQTWCKGYPTTYCFSSSLFYFWNSSRLLHLSPYHSFYLLCLFHFVNAATFIALSSGRWMFKLLPGCFRYRHASMQSPTRSPCEHAWDFSLGYIWKRRSVDHRVPRTCWEWASEVGLGASRAVVLWLNSTETPGRAERPWDLKKTLT